LHCAAGLVVRVAGQQRLRLLEAFGSDPDVAGQVSGRRRGRAALARAQAVADGAAALEASTLPQLVQIWLPGLLVVAGVVVHEKNVVGHGDLPRSLSRPCCGPYSALSAPASLFRSRVALPHSLRLRSRPPTLGGRQDAAWIQRRTQPT